MHLSTTWKLNIINSGLKEFVVLPHFGKGATQHINKKNQKNATSKKNKVRTFCY